LSQSVAANSISDIDCQRSQSIGSALLKAPYRTFLAGNSGGTSDLVLYCLPTVSEYFGFGSEANSIRTAILSTSSVVAVYDSQADAFVGCTTDDILSALSGDADKQGSLASAAMQALSSLDTQAAAQLAGSKKQSDTVVVVGSGGREHAIAVALARSPLVGKVICCPGNGGTAVEGGKISNAEGVNGKQDNDTVIALTKRVSAAMVVVGPEQPLVDGIVDAMEVECPGVKVFGPSKAAAELEASKAFTKDFLQEHGIPTAKYRNFTSADEAIAYVESLDENDRQVVKASGLAAGKGVLLPTTKAETIAAVKEIMSDKSFGAAGDTCVIESFMTGPEASCLAFCDGKTAVLMPAAQDHKRALDNDEGLNTGGMGAYAPAPVVTPSMQKEIEQMCITTVEKMAERGTPYVGVLYAGIM
jgi:D-alanine-D-alanine ligase-like ATP-grasp enzyme